MKKTRNAIQRPIKIVKIAPHTYCINDAGYKNMRDVLEFNKKIEKSNDVHSKPR